VQHPNHDPFTVSVNGQGGNTPSQGSQSGSQATTEPSSYAPIEVEGTENYDLVTLTYLDAACSEYGLTFHSFADLSAPVIQIVEGPVANDAAFASARTISGASISESTASTCEYTEYDPTNYTFVHTYENRGNVVNGVTTHIYKAKLDSLDFGKTYSYRVGDTALGTYSPVYTFTTRPQTVSDFSFIYTADTQPSCFDGLGYLGVNALFNKAFAKAPNAQFLVSGGDFVYCSDEGQSSITVWRNVINGGNNKNTGAAGSLFASHPWFIANGNHDANKVQQFLNNKVTGTGDANDYYSYDYGDAHFVVLDSGHNGSLDTAQLNWLSSDLASTTKKWKVLFLHFSLYCTTDRDLGVDKTTLAERSDRQTLLNIIDTNKVDLVVSAHVNESYYTSYPLKGGAKTADVPTKTGGVDCYTSPSGTIYMQNGGSGLGSDLKGGNKGKLNTNTQDVNVGFRNRIGTVLRDAEVGYEASYAVFDVSSTTLKVNRYYLDSGLNSVLYTNGQFQITK
ncbi:MAG: metallophosphoesterase family protein, partial [Clostridia bacterium]|nr:metallophosphoesterase family protein [Clostridia bacterium]